MSDQFITVASFNNNFEAQLAKNLLENEGIECIVVGAFSSDVLFGSITAGDPIILQVREEEAKRAAGVLTAVAAARLSEDWEQKVESESDVWICSICGEPISNRLSICHSCETPRESIRANAPRNPAAIQPDSDILPTGNHIQERDELTNSTHAPQSVPAPLSGAKTENATAQLTLSPGDELARRVFRSAVFGLFTVFLLPVAWYYLAKWIFFTGELSPRGKRYILGGLLLNGYSFLVLLLLWSFLRSVLK